jgi:undecaprenyl-phosphate 4-deoxy-4-formamido-L-arabinose transferase
MLQPTSRINKDPAAVGRPRPDEGLADGVSVVVPVYNSQGSLPELVARLEPVLAAIGKPFEAIFVNDGSHDRSWDVLRDMACTRPWMRGFSLMRNYGQHNALLCGIREARYAIVVTLDDDLQHPPEEIPRLLAVLSQGYDVVFGTPASMRHSLSRNFLSRTIKWSMALAIGVETARHVSAFRAFRTHIRSAFSRFQSPHLLLDVLLTWGTSKFGAIQVRHDARKVGRSNYTLLRLFNQTMLLLTGFSTAPLRLGTIIGFGMTLFGLCVLAYVLAVYVTVGSVPGFPFLAGLISIFGGAQLFCIGMIGEYLARIFNRSMDRPPYVVDTTLDCAEPTAPQRSPSTP